MSALTTVVAVLVLGAATYAMRGGLILVLADRSLPPMATRSLRNVAPAVLSALVVTLVADPDAARWGIEVAEVVGILIGGVVAWRTRNLLAALASGMAVFWLLLAVGG